MASVPSVDGVSGYSEPRITEAGGSMNVHVTMN